MQKKIERKIPTMKFFTALFILIVTLILSACATMYWGYKFADYYLEYKINDYFDLNDAQKDRVSALVDDVYEWHKLEELPEILTYADSVLKNSASVQEYGAETFTDAYDYFSAKRLAYVTRWHGRVAEILATLDREQIDYFHRRLIEANQEIIDDQSADDATLKAEQFESAVKNYKMYFGALSPAQIEKIRLSLNFSREYNELRMRSRVHAQTEFIRILHTVGDLDALKKRLYDMAINPESMRLPEYNVLLKKRRDAFQTFVIQFYNTLTVEQKNYFRKHIHDIITDLSAFTELTF